MVRLGESGGANPVAREFADLRALRAGSTMLRTYEKAGRHYTAVPLRPGGAASIALFSTGTGPRARVRSVTIYPSQTAARAGPDVTFGQPVSICGQPRVLPFLPATPGGKALAVARQALSQATIRKLR